MALSIWVARSGQRQAKYGRSTVAMFMPLRSSLQMIKAGLRFASVVR
jgi:hypothetical protein